jgi:hypothetical protein
MIWHDTESENPPILTVQAADFGGQEISVIRLREYVTSRGCTRGQ